MVRLSKTTKHLLIIFGAVVFSLLFYLANIFGLDPPGLKVLSVGVLLILLWVSDIVSMSVVAILPLVLFPLLKINGLEDTAKAY